MFIYAKIVYFINAANLLLNKNDNGHLISKTNGTPILQTVSFLFVIIFF